METIAEIASRNKERYKEEYAIGVLPEDIKEFFKKDKSFIVFEKPYSMVSVNQKLAHIYKGGDTKGDDLNERSKANREMVRKLEDKFRVSEYYFKGSEFEYKFAVSELFEEDEKNHKILNCIRTEIRITVVSNEKVRGFEHMRPMMETQKQSRKEFYAEVKAQKQAKRTVKSTKKIRKDLLAKGAGEIAADMVSGDDD